MAKQADNVGKEIQVLKISEGSVVFLIVGTMPLIYNAMSEKVQRELLTPSGRKTEADRAQMDKHNPLQEYRDSVYSAMGDKNPTRLVFPASAPKKCIMTAALDLPGTRKTVIGRLTWVEGYQINVWGVPKLMMSPVRNSDINRTPDIRTRAILEEWAMMVEFRFVRPQLNVTALTNLMAAAGRTVGIGDWRQEKGSASFGQYKIVEAGDKEFERICKEGGRKQQDAALEDPEFFDLASERLFNWNLTEIQRKRGRDEDAVGAVKPQRKRKNNGESAEISA